MSLIEFVPRGEPSIPVISVGTSVESHQYNEKGRTIEERNMDDELILFIDGVPMGRIDWETSDKGKFGYVDAIDAGEYLLENRLHDIAFYVIDECLRDSFPDVLTIEYGEGLELLDLPLAA